MEQTVVSVGQLAHHRHRFHPTSASDARRAVETDLRDKNGQQPKDNDQSVYGCQL